MQQLLRFVSVMETAEFAMLGIVAIVGWRRRGGETRGWLAATFGVLGLVLVIGSLIPSRSTLPSMWILKPALGLIVVFPYLLYRFMRSLGRTPRWLDAAAVGVTATFLGITVAMPRFPARGAHPSLAFRGYILLFIVQWVLLVGAVALRLWRAGKGRPRVARRRMRMLALGAGALVIVAVGGASHSTVTPRGAALSVVLDLIAIASGPLFLAGFAPPQALMRLWRREEDAALKAAIAELVVASDSAQLLSGLLPHVAHIVGAQSVALYDLDGRLLGSHGDFPADAPVAGTSDAGEPLERVELHIPAGTLVLLASRYTPYFGRDELELLRSLGVMASQALDRCRLLERERRTLEALEEAQRIAHLGSWRWVLGSNHIEWSPELYRIHNLDPATFTPSVGVLEQVCHPEDRAARSAAIQQAIQSGTTFATEYRIIWDTGEIRSLSGLGKVLRDHDGQPTEMIGTVQDVTEQRRLEALRTQFIANAAHELRTPLTTLAGMAMLLGSHRNELPEDTANQAFEALGRQGERARTLINNMLDLSQLESKRVPIRIEEVSLADVVSRAQEVCSRPEGTDVEIAVSGCLKALADPARLEQVVTNLLSNAYRYGGGHVRIEGSQSGGRILLAVADDGPGVPPELVETMFEPFTRGGEVTGTVGSGLGLAISRRIVEACAGRMTYQVQAPHGSRFVVELNAAA